MLLTRKIVVLSLFKVDKTCITVLLETFFLIYINRDKEFYIISKLYYDQNYWPIKSMIYPKKWKCKVYAYMFSEA